jgi:hypothetical protein
MLRDLLERAGIQSAIEQQNGNLYGHALQPPQLWVDDKDWEKAVEVKRDFLNAAGE